MKASLAIAALLLASPSALRAGAQSPSVEGPKEQLCKVSGIVVRAGDSSPLKKATVQLLAAGQNGESVSAHTGEDGKFVFDQIRAGRYRLLVSRNGYVTQNYGQRKASDPPAILSLSPGQKMSDLIFKLKPAAVISGHVQDEDGEPMPWVHIMAYKLEYNNGKREPLSEEETNTNDLGEYRLFGLTSGRYFLAANYEPGAFLVNGRRIAAVDNALNPGYVATYYPNTNDPAKAAAVSVKAGEQIAGIDLILSPAHVVKVRGRVYHPVGGKGESVYVSLTPRDSQFGYFAGRHTFVENKDGSFEIANVPPGPYFVLAQSSSEQGTYSARQSLDVGATDVDGVTLTMTTGQEVRGQLLWEGTPDTTAASHVMLVPLDEGQQRGWRPGVTSSGTSFTFDNVPEGPWRVQFFGVGPDAFVKSVRYGGIESSLSEFTVIRGVDTPLEVTVSSRGAHVDGTVTNANSLPAVGVWVALVPDPSRRKATWLFKYATTDQRGHFELRGIVPGEYKLFSWDQVEEGAWEDPEFLKTFEEKGQEVSAQEGERKSVELVTIPGGGGGGEQVEE
jgi:Carboxypeptidase regulatory-like domain